VSELSHNVAQACAESYSDNKDCNKFVKDFAAKVGVKLPGGIDLDADGIIAGMETHWRNLSQEQAISAAGRGVFVVAGLKKKDIKTPHTNGHVCVVIPGRHGAFPRVYSTSADKTVKFGRSQGDTHLSGFVFRSEDAKNVQYFGPTTGSSGSW